LINQAINTLNAEPTACAIVAKSAAVMNAARSTGVATIGYARTAADHDNLGPAHPGTIIADLVCAEMDLTKRTSAA